MASIEQCNQAFHALADKLAAAADGASARQADFDRTVSCTLHDLGVSFAGHLHDGRLTDIRQVETADAQIRMTMSGDDLLALVAGELDLAAAWAAKRVTIDASMLDLLKLRSLF